jgi:hypothetical protein
MRCVFPSDHREEARGFCFGFSERSGENALQKHLLTFHTLQIYCLFSKLIKTDEKTCIYDSFFVALLCSDEEDKEAT